MEKKQYLLAGVMLIVFFALEIVFGVVYNSAMSILGLPFHSVNYNLQLFIDHPWLLNFIIFIELVIVSWLLRLNARRSVKSLAFKKFLVAIGILVDLFLLFLLTINFLVSKVSFP